MCVLYVCLLSTANTISVSVIFHSNMDYIFVICYVGIEPDKTTMAEVYQKFGLDQNTADFTGHALALYRDDRYV